ncbi:MAG TPA: AAA family ATPase [Anaerolineae bacterium]|nr:AAA family ATPase [Anaerolineae bacterium]
MLSIQLLGTPVILQDDQPLAIPRKKSRALVYYLAAHDKPLTREQILSFFWPDSDRVSAQQVLRTTLHGLRQALGTALITDENMLALAPEINVDVRVFETALQRQPLTTHNQLLTTTLQLYRGDFLAGFSLSDSAEFDDWLTEQQEHYRRLAIRGFIALAALHEQQQNYPAALEALDRALAFDPLQEDVQRSALRVHYLAGDRTGAIRRYGALRKLLDEEMGIPPMAETRALYDEIIKDQLIGEQGPVKRASRIRPPSRSSGVSISDRPSTIGNLPFTGRDTELKKLKEAAASHQLALIEGEPGIGKTRLAAEFLRTQTGLVLIGAAHELEHARPYHPFIDALRILFAMPGWSTLQAQLDLPAVWWHELARLVPEIVPQAASSAADESRLWEGVHQFLIALSRLQPIVLFLDDVQWADVSTLGLLGYLARVTASARSASIVLVAASRPIEPRTSIATLVQSLTREGRVLRLALDRLSVSETTALAQQISPAFAYPLAEWLRQQSEGNPYILSELITHARESGLLRADGTVNLSALSTAPVVPPSIYSLIQARLARLSDPARRILDAAVAMGRIFEFEVVARAAALSENAALDALDELRAARLIEPQGSDGLTYAFDHSLTMEVAYREVGEPRHRLLHRRVAEALEAIYGKQYLDGIASVVAWHFRESGDVQRAAPYALHAAQLAAKIAAWREAIEFYDQALAADLPDLERAEILLELGAARINTGETAQAVEANRAALKLCAPNSMEADRARLALAQSLLNQARYAEAIDLVKQVCAAGRPEMIVGAEMQWGTTLSVEGADLIEAAEHLNQAEMLLRQQSNQPDVARLAQIKFEQGSVAAQQGDLEKAVILYRDTIELGAQSGQAAVPFHILGYNNLAYHSHLLHDPSALNYAQQGLQLAREQGVLGLQPFLLSTLGEIELERDADVAEQYFTEGLTLAERLSMPERIAGLTANLGRVAQRRGETALAIHRLSTALAKAEALGLLHLAAQIRLWLVPLLPPNEARAALNEVKAMATSSGRQRLWEEAQRLEKDVEQQK